MTPGDSGAMILDLDALEREADAWLLAQPTDRALCPCEVTFFRRRFCLPWPLVDLLRRGDEKDPERS